MKGFLDGLMHSDIGKSLSKEHREELDEVAKELRETTEKMLMSFATKTFSIIEKGVKLEEKKSNWRKEHGKDAPFPSEYVDREGEINEMIHDVLSSTTMALNIIHLAPLVRSLDIIRDIKEKEGKNPVQ